MKKFIAGLILAISLTAASAIATGPTDYYIVDKYVTVEDRADGQGNKVLVSYYSNPRFIYTFKEKPLKAVSYWFQVANNYENKVINAGDDNYFYTMNVGDIITVDDNGQWEKARR